MAYKIAVNGYGRIGRCVVRALYESRVYAENLSLVAINEAWHPDTVLHLTRFDSTHGRFPKDVRKTARGMAIEHDEISLLQEKTIENLPWKDLEVDAVLDCTGVFNDRQAATLHIRSGAAKVIYSNPGKDEMDATIIYGVNHSSLKAEHAIISNASCTSNCLIPILSVIDAVLGIDCGSVTTIHSAMNDQPVIDAYNTDLRKTRSALQSIIPVTTSLAKGIGRILPHLDNRFETLAIRVPTTNVSIMDITLVVASDTDADQVNTLLARAAETDLEGILGVNDEQLVSCDFNHDPRSAIVDLSQTRVSGSRLVKIQAWFDNEWGYSNRMIDTTIAALDKLG
ncbi:glyceraldehyde 3-phosphate dehydrogenase NAD-binding domain-containing protein [uncultured Desulfobacter sp.]|uniref:type I glyceraldehyde-3-phosphate dehydrogenase n=1 Tax=uncultured Desulfobacter sp. TaxID=240139 RepID=UPI002AAA6EC7|nr:glyceraldehyde 3-phosphate dehydrogenase NAD-binding domain-containing protein [uncultured Desulfobacter sp.]